MEEKKVTDEEIVKALECCSKNNPDCDNCPCSVGGGSLCRQPEQQALDIIHRLQDENKRLTEENEHLDMVAKQALADYQNAQVQVDECKEILERRAVNNFAWEAGKIVAELESIKPTVRETYGGEEQVGVDIAINRIKTMVKSKGVEVE